MSDFSNEWTNKKTTLWRNFARLNSERWQSYDGGCSCYACEDYRRDFDRWWCNEFFAEKLESKIMTETKEMPDWLINPKPIKSEDIDAEQIARMDTAILKANLYFQKKYWPSKMIEIPLKDGTVIQTSSTPPMELFWTPSRHRSHEMGIGYAIVWGYDIRYLHHGSDYPSPAYSLYHGPISLFIGKFSENTAQLDDWEKYILSGNYVGYDFGAHADYHADYSHVLKAAAKKQKPQE